MEYSISKLEKIKEGISYCYFEGVITFKDMEKEFKELELMEREYN